MGDGRFTALHGTTALRLCGALNVVELSLESERATNLWGEQFL